MIPSRPVSRDNHYVPQALLRRWSVDGSTVFARRLLVSHSAVPDWQRMPIKGVAYQRDLYTSLLHKDEVDEFERWIATEFERPASLAIDKVVQGTRLLRDDWHSLARFLALQDLRTPATFLSLMERWTREMRGLVEDTMRQVLQDPAKVHAGRPKRLTQAETGSFRGIFHVFVEEPAETDGQTILRTEVTLGRGLWLANMRHLLNGVAHRLTEHRWTIVESDPTEEWPLSDNPALKLNYRSPTDYDFGGGWGKRKVNLMMPLSPRHLLFTQVGQDFGRTGKFSQEQTKRIRRFLVERAHRWVFATRPLDWVTRLRARVEDAAEYDREAELWKRWPQDQLRAELPENRYTSSPHF